MTLTTVLNAIVFVAAALSCGAYLCRLDAINWFNTRPTVVAYNLAMFGTCGGVMLSALAGDVSVVEGSALLGAALWLHISLPTWGAGQVPLHAQTGPAPLDRLGDAA